MSRVLFAALSVLATGCLLDPPAGGGGGGGGGTGGGGAGGVAFKKGVVFARRDDGNIYVADQSDYTTATALTTFGGGREPSLSKDGRSVVFVRAAAGDTGILTVPAQGGAETTILVASATPGISNVRSPVFTPDGLHIIFSFDDGAGSSIGGVDVTGLNPVRLSGDSAFSFSGASMYPDGTGLLTAGGPSVQQLTQLVRIDPVTTAQTNVSSTLGLDAITLFSRVVVSPDGTKAAFDAVVSSGSSRIFVMDLATTVVTQLTDYPGAPGANDSSPCWVGVDQVCFSSTVSGADAAYVLPVASVRAQGTLQVTGALDPWYGPN